MNMDLIMQRDYILKMLIDLLVFRSYKLSKKLLGILVFGILLNKIKIKEQKGLIDHLIKTYF